MYHLSHNNKKGSIAMKMNFFKFVTSSFMGFLIDYTMFCVLSLIFPDTKIYILLINIIARITSSVCNYMINCHFVFKEKQNFKSAFYYFLLALFILCMNNIVLLIYSAIPDLPLYIAKIFTELTLFIISYTIQKKIIFHHKI